MRNIKLTLAYDGTEYSGWQRQPHNRSIQGELERALSIYTGEPVTVAGSSRTDAGVHANNHVSNFFTECAKDFREFRYAVNALLPRDIRVKHMEEVPDTFHARYGAKAKTYVYHVDNSGYGDPFTRRYAWKYRYDVDVPRMAEASQHFLGTHDFSAFMSSGTDMKTFTRTIYSFSVERHEHLIDFTVHGNGFLYNMVRIMVGTLVMIGNGRLDGADLPDIIASMDRKRAGITAPPEGLFLDHIEY